MKGEVLANTELLFMPEITIVLFVSVFVGAMFWMFRPGSKQAYAARALMPLVDEPVEPNPARSTEH